MALTELGLISEILVQETAPTEKNFTWGRQLDPVGDPLLVDYYRYDSTQSKYSPIGNSVVLDPVINQVNAVPGSPTQWDRYLVGTSPTGDFASYANQLAIYNGNAWEFYAIKAGGMMFNTTAGNYLYYNGTNWLIVPTTSAPQKIPSDSYVIAAPGSFIYTGSTQAIWTFPDIGNAVQGSKIEIKNKSDQWLRLNAASTGQMYTNEVTDFHALAPNSNYAIFTLDEDHWTL